MDINDIIKKRRAILEALNAKQAESDSPETFDAVIAQEETHIKELVDVACHRITGKELAEEMSNFVNSFGYDSPSFIEGFTRQHRTLQQSMTNLMLQTIEAVASDDYRTDARNEDSHKIAKQLVEGFKMVKKEEFAAQRGGILNKYDEDYIESESFLPSKHLGFV